MPKVFLVGLLLLVPLSVCAQDNDHTPAATVLSMSVTQWDSFYARHHGGEETEVTERESLPIYGSDLEARNKTALRRLPVCRVNRLRRYEDIVGALHGDALGLASDNNGGGTMYEEINDSATVDDEQLIWERIKSPALPLTSAERVEVRANFAALRRAIRRARPTQFVTPRQFSQDVAALRRDEGQLSDLVASDPTHDALAVSRYVVKEIIPEMSPTYP
jgi:hypothetical protein